MRTRLAVTGSLLTLAAGLVATPASATPGGTGAAVAAAPAVVADVMARTGVPGVAVAVVKDGTVVYSSGFGVRDLRTGKPVTSRTVFQLASLSKPVGASVVAASVGRGTVSWDDPVVDHLPWFTLSDPDSTAHVTIGDLYAHRSGLPGDSGNDLESLGMGQRSIIERLRYEPLTPLRSAYAYSNFGMTTGGRAVAAAARTPWDRLARQQVFRPLGMRDTSFAYSDFARERNRAALSVRTVDGRWIPGPVRDADPQAPAGGLSSTVLDMARWMSMEMALGAYNGWQVIDRAALSEALTVQSHNAPGQDAQTGYGYGMLLSVNTQGDVMWRHSGAFSAGAATTVTMIPGQQFGVVVLTNGAPVGAPEAIAAGIVEAYYDGTAHTDWLTAYAPFFADFGPTFTIDGQPAPADPAPARALRSYAGTYSSPYVGRVRISVRHHALWATFATGLRVRVRHWDGDVFYLNAPGETDGYYAAVRFDVANRTATFDLFNSGLGELQRVR